MKIVAKCLAFVYLSYKVHAKVYNPISLMKKQFIDNPQCSNGSPYGLKEHKNALWRLYVFVCNIIETLCCYKLTLLNSLEIF